MSKLYHDPIYDMWFKSETGELPKPTPAISFLKEASSALKDRASQRDTPEGERSMSRTVALFNAYKGEELLSETDGWVFMVFLKLIRGDQGKFIKDDYVDGAGYMALAGEAKSKEEVLKIQSRSNLNVNL